MKFGARNTLAVVFVFSLLILSSVILLFAGFPTAPRANSSASPPRGIQPAASYGHGDLIVSSGQTVVLSPGTTGSSIYYEAGNISVHSGGTLIVQNLTIDWVQFIGVTGTVAQRLSNVFWFNDAGTVTLSHSIITTDPNVLNAFAKLNVTVTGKLVVSAQSQFQFPGWVTVGTGGSLFLNYSTSTGNPQVGSQTVNGAILADEPYSPALQAVAGGQIFIGHSIVQDYYADNYVANGVPSAVLAANSSDESQTPNYAWTGFDFGPPVAQGIAQAYAWEGTPIVNATLQVGYIESASGGYTAASGSDFTYRTIPYGIGQINFPYAPAGAVVDIPLPAAAVTAITGAGVPAFLQDTGSFGTTSAEAVHFDFSAASVNVTSLSLSLLPSFQYNLSATGAGSVVTVADSTVGINFNPVPGTPVSRGGVPPVPWLSNKLLVSGGANAFLGNMTVVGAPFAPFNDSSAVIPSGTSQAYFYQWLEVPITGGLNNIPVAGGITAATYAGSSASLRATVASLNALGTADPVLAAYVTQSLAARGLTPSTSGGNGIAWSLLLSTIVDPVLLPTGQFVGAYNVTVTVPPGGPGEVATVAASLTPYPQVVSPGGPFASPPASFPGYAATLDIAGTTSLVAHIASSTVEIGQVLEVDVNLRNTGTAPTNNYTVTLSYPEVPTSVIVATSGLITSPIGAGQNVTVPLTWLVSENVTGRQGVSSFLVSLGVDATWNGGLPDGGTNSTLVPVTFTPAAISLVSWALPNARLPTNGSGIESTGEVMFAGYGAAAITIFATGAGGTFVIGSTNVHSGDTFEVSLTSAPGMSAGTTYTIKLEASYNGRTLSQTSATSLTVAGTPPTTNVFSFLTMTFFGQPLWLWLGIGGVIVAVLVGALLAVGRFARGRLVECGECGNLIPENASVCPRCGAEFETDLVRCSRCGSTIPATSAVCPECAATLLARAGPENADPERQAYADFAERFRTDAKKELGTNYSEGAFWDWWKRQQTYMSFSQWRLQQAQGTRSGMTAPVMKEAAPTAPPRRPPSGGGAAVMSAARPAAPRPAPPVRPAAPPATPTMAAPVAAAAAGAGAAPAGMKNCPNCGKQINAEFLVCPFCGSVTG